MLDFTRYKGLATVCAGLLCAFVLCNTVLIATFGPQPTMFNDPDRRLAWHQLELMGAQVAGAEQAMQRNGLNRQPDFGIVLGQSTTLRDIDPRILEQQCEPHMPWLLLNGFGSSFVKLNYYAQTLLVSRLHPRVVVLGLHETMLAGQGQNHVEPAEHDDVMDQSKPDESDRHWRREIKHLIWVRTQRADISHRVNMALFEARLSMHRTLGSGSVGLFTPADEPWVSRDHEELPDRQLESFLQRQADGWRDFGWYNPSSYDTTNRHAEAFRELIASCDALGPRQIVIVLMPITSDLRSWLPDNAMSSMCELIDEVSVGRPVRVIDMREAMPDNAFADYAHLNPHGREIFSTMLSKRLYHPGDEK